ncbi:MAG: gamma-glutamyltransferase, partial [Chloroflexota bacterium]|nr:gamma-glutamyltransferase [Chloroflexota bacterium]
MVQSPHGIEFESNRPVVMGRNGMVCAGHPLAAQAGMATLQKGGNAVDAAIATAAALNVVEPNMSGVGGDGYIMIYDKARNKIDICNATGAAPYATDLAWYQANGIPQKGIMSFSVPGLVDGWMAAHERYGTQNLSDLFSSAIDLADNGFPVTHILSRVIASDPLICEFPTSQAIFAPGGKPLQPGQMLYQKDLARTFQAIVDGGRDAFYEGAVAKAMVDFCQ